MPLAQFRVLETAFGVRCLSDLTCHPIALDVSVPSVLILWYVEPLRYSGAEASEID